MNSRGYIFLEYGFLLAIIVIAVLTMTGYISRSLQGKLRESLDDVGPRYGYGTITGECQDPVPPPGSGCYGGLPIISVTSGTTTTSITRNTLTEVDIQEVTESGTRLVVSNSNRVVYKDDIHRSVNETTIFP